MIKEKYKSELYLGEIMEDAFLILKKHFWGLLIIILIFSTSIFLISYNFTQNYLVNSFETFKFLLSIIIQLLLGLIPLISYILYTDLETRESEYDKATWAQAVKASFSRWASVLNVYLIYILVSIVGYIVLIIPGIIATVFFIFGIQSVVIKKITGIAALEHSVEMVKNRWFRTAGYIIMFFSPYIIIELIVLIIDKTNPTLFNSGSQFNLSSLISTILYSIFANLCEAYAFIAMTIYFINVDYLKRKVKSYSEEASE